MFSLHHIAISTENMDKLVVFYKKLGFSLLKEHLDENLKITWLSNKLFIIEIFEYKNPIIVPKDYLEKDLLKTGLKHFAFAVNDITLLHKKFSTIFTVGKIKEGRMGSRYFFIQDPDGNFIEYIEK